MRRWVGCGLPGRKCSECSSWSDSVGKSDIDAVTVLDDGTVLLASSRGMFEITPAGLVQPLPKGADLTVWHGALAPTLDVRRRLPRAIRIAVSIWQ